MDIDFTGNRALVTGAGKGIGREVALRLAECGAQVVAISRTQADLDSLHASIGCQIIQADLSSPDEATQAAEAAGEIDLLVNNAGISILQPFFETTIQAFDQIMAVNVRAVLLVSQVVAGKMVARGSPGAIVNVSSQSSTRALQDHTAYCTSKGALDQLTRMMALELGPHNIRVNAVNPTITLTPMGERVWSDPIKSAPMMARIPLRRFARPRDVAEVICYLLSDRAAMMNGAFVPVEGGFWVT
jgi:L-xylulose reductase